MRVGIVGLPYSGKSTLFEAITGAHGTGSDRSGAAQVATIAVPDERIDKIAQTIQPKKVTYAHVDFVDVAGVGSEMEREQVLSTLSALRESDGLVHVIRFFDSPSAPPHPRKTLDPIRDAKEMEAELIVADLAIVEGRVQKLEKQITKFTATLEKDKKELALMQRMQKALETGELIRTLSMTAEESLLLRTFQFLSEKPMLKVLNVHEDALHTPETAAMLAKLGANSIAISARAEKDIAELEPAERQEFLDALKIGEPAARRIIRACYDALGLRSFITAGEPDVHAWTIRVGDNALTAAGKIHSDIARGFIRAEVIGYKDFEEFGSIKEAKNQGRQRLEGKEYVVQDGDIITVRFKV